MVPDPRLLDFCTTEKQTEKIQAWIEHGSLRKAAAALGHGEVYRTTCNVSMIG